ncbi:BglG family transcription antiterminator [Bacillus toyonensis]|uniref:BglG family transcription antiterminator n=1 Tax=Bacillus toyonensis TaxID=155322 RepID=UPI000BFCBDDF|nr:helix-turn-helix domain-containing protein [Bacillus toyonensis]PHG59743.1 hypothetical protein COI59_26335 [Bacillus toyonensis]
MINRRQAHLIQILIQDKQWHTLIELSVKLKCSIKTVRRDLLFLKGLLPIDWNLIISKGKGVYIEKPLKEDYNSLLFCINQFKFEPLIQILQHLFIQDIQKVQDIAEKLYIQNSAVYQHLNKVEKYLQKFDLQLEKKPLRIEGNEIHIIFMFYDLFFNVYDPYKWPFEYASKDILLEYITDIEKKIKIQLYPIYKRKFIYFLAVLLHRKKQGYTFSLSPIFVKRIQETSFYKKIAVIADSIEGQDLQIEDFIIITIIINCSEYIYVDEAFCKKEMLQDFHQEKSLAYKYAKEFIYMLERSFKISLINDSEFTFLLLQHLKKTVYRYQIFSNIQPPASLDINIIKKKYPNTFQSVSQVYHEWVQNYNISLKVWEADIAIVTIQLEGTGMLMQNEYTNVGLYTDGNMIWNRYIQGILRMKFGNKLEFFSPEMKTLINSTDNNLNFSFLITTYPIDNVDIPIIKISLPPTERDLEEIENLVSKYKKQTFNQFGN